MKTLALILCSGALLHAATFYVTVAGLGGEPEYEQRFPDGPRMWTSF